MCAIAVVIAWVAACATACPIDCMLLPVSWRGVCGGTCLSMCMLACVPGRAGKGGQGGECVHIRGRCSAGSAEA